MDGRSEAARRVRLEGRAELLETAVLRGRALVNALRGFGWKRRLRRLEPILRESARSQAAVADALDVAARHAKREGWPRNSGLRRTLEKAQALSSQLVELCARRLGRKVPSLGEGFAALEKMLLEDALKGRAWVPLGERVALAEQLLEARPLELGRVALFGDRLRELFSRPLGVSGELRLTVDEVRDLAQRFDEGEGALEALWARLDAVDRSGALGCALRGRARRAPVRPSRNAVETLLQATFWWELARERLRAAAASHVSPLSAVDVELFEVTRWLRGLLEMSSPSVGMPGARGLCAVS